MSTATAHPKEEIGDPTSAHGEGLVVCASAAASPLVLGYHALSETWPATLSVKPAAFRAQIEWLLARGYRAATLHEALTAPSPSQRFVVTFDDAYASVLRVAHPILSSLGVPATVFVVTDFAGGEAPLEWPGIDHWRGGPHATELQGLGWSELDRLAGEGWEIGSHTRTHPHLTHCSDDELVSELRGSREACERTLGRPCHTLAYPYGNADARVLRAAAGAGYSIAVIDDLARPRPLAWPRVGVYRQNSMTTFRIKASPNVRRLRAAFGSAERTLGRSIDGRG